MNARVDFQTILGADGKPAFVVVPYAQFLKRYGQANALVPDEVVKLRPDTKYVRIPDWIEVFAAWGVAAERGDWVGTWTEPDGPLVIGGSYQARWRQVSGAWLMAAELFVPAYCSGGACCTRHPRAT